MSQSPLPDAALAVLENAINHYLALDPEAAGRLSPLEGYIIAFEFKGFGSRLYFIPGPEGFQIYGAYDAEPDCLLRGTPLALARLGMSGRKEDALFSGQVEIEGDTALARRFGDCMAGLEIDWEEQLSRLTGDSVAHAVGTRLRAAGRWGQGSLDTLGQDLKEYLQEEGRLLPTRYEIDQFLAAVDRLRDDGERLAARVERLRQRIPPGAGAPPRRGPTAVLTQLSRLWRLIHISLVLVRHGLDEVLLATHLFRPVYFLSYLSPWYWYRRTHPKPYPVRIREALIELGPIFVKFGQILSTRRDLLPDDLADELAKLQDQVPPFPGTQARAIIEKSWGKPIEAVLDGFDEQPLASASIAQVHIARLKDGREVVVKVVRPGIERIIRRDLGLLLTLAELAHRYWKDGRRLRPVEVVKDYQKTILDELDLQREAANASQLRKNFLGSSLLYVPEVYWDLCHPSVMVMERIHGTPVGEVERLKAEGVSMKLLGERGVEIFFTQVFQHNFFHADMHPGNIFVEPGGRYIAVDFGIVGTLTTEDQRYLAENLLAFFHHDYRRVAELHIESGWIPAHTRVDEFESAIRTVCEPIFGKPLAQISFGYFLLHLFQTARRFDMEVQPQLVLLQKTLLNIEGLGRQLYPELDLWTTAKPFMEKWMRNQIGPRALLARLKRNLGPYSEGLPELPLLAYRVLQGLDRQSLPIRWSSDELDRLRNEIRAHHARVQALLAGAGLIASGTLLLVFGPGPLLTIPTAQALAIGLIGVGGLWLAARWR